MTTAPRTRGALVRGGGTVLAGLLAWNIGNYAFFLVAGRVLGPSDYGLVAALLAATLVVAVPAQSLQFATARLIAAPPAGDRSLANGIYRLAVRRCVAVTATLSAGTCILILIGHAAGLGGSPGPYVVTAALVAPLGFFFLALGRLQGDERFAGFATCFALWGMPRPLAVVPLAALGLGVYAGLGGTALAVASATVAAVWLTRSSPPGRRPAAAEWRAFSRPLVPVLVGLTGLGILTNLDVIVAKVALPSEQAGHFAAAAALAKAVFLIPQAVSFVLLPRVAAGSAAAQDTGLLLRIGVGLTLALGGLASLGLWLVASQLLRITYGPRFVASSGLLGGYAAASTLIGALIVVINHHVGRHAVRFAWATACVALAQAVLLLLLNDSARAIIAADAAAGGLGLIVHECMFARTPEAILYGLARKLKASRPVGRPSR